MQSQVSEFLSVWIYPLAEAGVLVAAGFWGSGFLGRIAVRMARNAKLSEALARFLGQAARYLVLAVAFITAASAVGLETTSLVALLGSVGLAIGLALQGSLSHLASGVMLLIFRPFDIDDRITAAGHTGVVEQVGLFATTLFTPTHDTIFIPNGAIASGSIINHTRRGVLRGSVSVGVAYGVDVEAVVEELRQAAESVEAVLDDPGVGVAFTELGASSLDFRVSFHVPPAELFATTGAVRKAVYDRLNAAGIDIPYQTIVVQQTGGA